MRDLAMDLTFRTDVVNRVNKTDETDVANRLLLKRVCNRVSKQRIRYLGIHPKEYKFRQSPDETT